MLRTTRKSTRNSPDDGPNEDITVNSKGIVTILHECSPFNLLGDLHPTKSAPVMYDNGNRTIDHIFGSSQVKNLITRGAALPFYHFIQADHRALYIDFVARCLFGGSQNDGTSSRHRSFISTNLKELNKYLTAVKEYWRDIQKDYLSACPHRLDQRSNHGNIDRAMQQGE